MDSFVIWLLVYFVLASQFYIWDKKGSFYLSDFYLYLHNLGHREEITKEQLDRGFVYNQPVSKKITFALFFDIFISGIFWYFNSLDMGVKILLAFAGTPIVFFGFWFGGFMMEMAGRVFKKTVNTIDDIETGKFNPTDTISKEIEEMTDNLSSKAKDFIGEFDNSKSLDEEAKKLEEKKRAEEKRKKEDEEALAALREFQKGK